MLYDKLLYQKKKENSIRQWNENKYIHGVCEMGDGVLTNITKITYR